MVVDKRFMLIGLALLAIALVGCTLPTGTQTIISADQLTLIDGATFWRVTSTTADQSEDIAFLKGTTKTVDGITATFTSDITIRIRPMSSKLIAPISRLVTSDSQSQNGELRYSLSDGSCAVSFGTGISPIVFGQKDIQIKYSVEVLENGVRVADGYREVTWGGPGSTPQNELLLANGRVKLNNIAMLVQGIPYPELSDAVWLPAKEFPNGGNFDWTIGKSKSAFQQRFMTICNNQRWKCDGINCYSDFRTTWIPNLPIASGYAGTGAVFKGFWDGSTVWWALDSSRAAALITITVSTDLGTLVVKPNVKKPILDFVQCDSLVQGQSGSASYPDISVGLLSAEVPKVSGSVEVTVQSTKSSVAGTPTTTTYFVGSVLGFVSTAGNTIGTDTITVKACALTTFPNLPTNCVTKTCERGITSSQQTCTDGTAVGACVNGNKPYYCNAVKQLVQNSQVCGCPDGLNPQADGTCKPLPPSCNPPTVLQPDGTCKIPTDDTFPIQTLALVAGGLLVAYLLFKKR